MDPGIVPLYPQSLLLTETPDHYIAELIGVQTKFKTLRHKAHKSASTDLYFNQFHFPDDTPSAVVYDSVTDSGMSGGLLVPADTEAEVEARYPGLSAARRGARFNFTHGSPDLAIFSFNADSNRIFLEDVTAINRLGNAVRARHIHLALVISRDERIPEYVRYLRETFAVRDGERIHGLLAVNAEHEASLVTAGQLSNLFLMDRLHETNLTDFLEDHREIVLHALGARDLRFQPQLHWRAGNPDPADHFVQPDLLVQRTSGQWDICDAKLALLPRMKLTKGERRRRQLIDVVATGVAQLAHYRDYFNYAANRAEAVAKYQVTVTEPGGVLIVGNYENVDKHEVAEALRAFTDVEIIDWDSLLQLYLGEKSRASSATLSLR